MQLNRLCQMFPGFPEIVGIFPQNLHNFPSISSIYSLRAMRFVPLVLSPTSKQPTQLLTNSKGKNAFVFNHL